MRHLQVSQYNRVEGGGCCASCRVAKGIESQLEVISNEGRAAVVLYGSVKLYEAFGDCAIGHWVCLTFLCGYVCSPEFSWVRYLTVSQK